MLNEKERAQGYRDYEEKTFLHGLLVVEDKLSMSQG
jgi:hypothetical protein